MNQNHIAAIADELALKPAGVQTKVELLKPEPADRTGTSPRKQKTRKNSREAKKKMKKKRNTPFHNPFEEVLGKKDGGHSPGGK